MERLGALAAGSAMGLLMGLMIGLSASPVVGAVVAGLVTLLASFFGLRNPDTAGTVTGAADGMRAWTVVGFGVAGALATLLGLYLRANGALSPSPQERLERWTHAGYDSTRARALTEFELTGLIPDSLKVSAPQPARGSETLLFSGEREKCERVSAETLADASSMRRAFIAVGGEWRSLAEAVAGLPEEPQRRVLLGSWRLACHVS
jgi:hypothetical protein